MSEKLSMAVRKQKAIALQDSIQNLNPVVDTQIMLCGTFTSFQKTLFRSTAVFEALINDNLD